MLVILDDGMDVVRMGACKTRNAEYGITEYGIKINTLFNARAPSNTFSVSQSTTDSRGGRKEIVEGSLIIHNFYAKKYTVGWVITRNY